MPRKKKPKQAEETPPDLNRLDERAEHVRENIYYVPQKYLDAIANARQPAFNEQVWVEVYTWGGQWGWETRRGAFKWGVMGAELHGLAGEILVVSDEWKRADAFIRRQEEAEEAERRINSAWNIERAAKLAKMSIAVFQELPKYEQRRYLLEADFEDQNETYTRERHALYKNSRPKIFHLWL